MPDFSRCPSCGAPGEVTKSNSYRYRHREGCKMGRLVLANPPGHLVTQMDPMIQDLQNKGHAGIRKCSACGTYVSSGHFPGPVYESEWRAPDECPTCWAIHDGLELGGAL